MQIGSRLFARETQKVKMPFGHCHNGKEKSKEKRKKISFFPHLPRLLLRGGVVFYSEIDYDGIRNIGFMKIVIKTKNVELTPALKEWIEEKINLLEKFLKIFQEEKYFDHFFGKGKPRVEAWVEVGKETRHHQKGPFYFAECQMRFPKRSVRSEAFSKNLREAIIMVKDELQRQLKQYKERIPKSLARRRQRALKKELKIHQAARFYRKGRIKEEGM